MDASGLTAYDFVVLGLLTILVVRGLWIGFVIQVTSFLALYFGYFVASQHHQTLFPFLQEVSDNPKVVFLTSYVLLFIGTYLLCMIIGKGLRYVMQISFTSWFDRLLGAIIGLGKAVILIVMMHLILGTLLAPENQMLRKCASCDIVNDLSDTARKFIKDSEVQKALKNEGPAISIERVKEYLQPVTKPE